MYCDVILDKMLFTRCYSIYMAFRYTFCIRYFISTCTADIVSSMVGNVYNQMRYNSTGSTLARLATKSKFLCAGQCANQFINCSTAVFDSSVTPQCLLFSEVVVPANLVVSINAVVYDFQQSKYKGREDVFGISLSRLE